MGGMGLLLAIQLTSAGVVVLYMLVCNDSASKVDGVPGDGDGDGIGSCQGSRLVRRRPTPKPRHSLCH